MDQRSVKSSERRERILNLLKHSREPIKGSDLAEMLDVSRQVIVGDVSLLKAKNLPIVATSQGYLFMSDQTDSFAIERTIACKHLPEESEIELNILVDHGVFVKDVTVEHPVYGDLMASLRIANRRDVKKFMEEIRATSAAFLLELTGGIHLHTIAADNEGAIQEALEALEEKGILLQS
ncbi:transcription repressor NadR [Thalassobacillus hwangdonensis]|uniref:Transcription repressor NadR n=1 Tax=Thalassobacillus hwangdonensis TaxID=546108 RepID=A0ABW3L4N2_9BACI